MAVFIGKAKQPTRRKLITGGAALAAYAALTEKSWAANDICSPTPGLFNPIFNPVFPGCSSYVLDLLSAFPAVAYSVRLLTATYLGKCMNVRRSTDNATTDIGFVNGVLDTVTLLAFCGSGNGFVTKWYNQGSLGSAGDASQSTAASQPQIVAAGVVEAQNGVPTVYFGGSQFLQTASLPVATINSNSGLFANSVSFGQVSGNLFSNRQTSGTGWYQRFNGSPSVTLSFAGGAQLNLNLPYNVPYILSMNWDGTTLTGSYNGNRSTATGVYNPTTSSIITIGTYSGFSYTGYGSEFVGINSSILSLDWATLELSQAAFFSIPGVTQ